MMGTEINKYLINESLEDAVANSFEAMLTSQEYVDRLVADLRKYEKPDDGFVTTLITTQEQIDQLVEDLLRVTRPAASCA